MMRALPMAEYLKCRAEGDVLVDLRGETAYRFGTVPGAVNIPVERLGELYQLPRDREIYLFCQTGELSGQLAELLSDAGYRVCDLTGGYRAYLRCGLAGPRGEGRP